MKTIYKLVGYDRKTERQVEKHIVPDRFVAEARQIAGAYKYDADQLGDLPLGPEQARRIAQMIGVKVQLDKVDYLLEPYRAATPAHA